MFDNFVQADADKFRDVRNALNSSRQKAVEENRNRLSMINGLLFHMTQPTSRSIIKAIACSKPIVREL